MMDRRTAMTAGALGLAAASALEGRTALAQQPAAPAAAPAPAAPRLPYRAHSIRTPDGVQIAAYEFGNPDGPAILFIHGYQQAAMSWDRQLRNAELAREFRMVAYDIRGHGMSDKPVGDPYYKPGRVWADEMKAVIEALNLSRPVVVGWSYAGRIMGDYLTAYGHDTLGATNWVAATSSLADPSRIGRGVRHIGPNAGASADPLTAIRATIAFLRDCFEIQPNATDFEIMLGFNMMVPRHVRLGLGGRPLQIDDRLRALAIPTLVTHGQYDKVSDVSMGRYTASVVPNARLSVYDGVGHAPFWEDAPRFNRELAELARSVRR